MAQTGDSKHFEPSEHFLKLKGKDYLPVAWRLVWFRQDHPDWAIDTELVEHDAEGGRAVFKASVGEPAGATVLLLASGYKQETRKDFPDYLEKAETGAIGRALAALGYGTQFAPELEEGARIVDSPVDLAGGATFVCVECKHPIQAQSGDFINASQADLIKERYGRLVCRDHRPTKAAA